jgi:hypothetical protein
MSLSTAPARRQALIETLLLEERVLAAVKRGEQTLELVHQDLNKYILTSYLLDELSSGQ